ncbi:hypothetical protein TARUN_994 [Trichoderma arundinaceum]|uniref:ATP-dependent DNA ligase family profile domain-containing protein n=1 Tax=Trichoderma arundinaceum TaxID=490622 RepID=A0A395NZN4_TRIAR|nr:hypothetical protein TARUN_994 [Trichoderma arundinaceum]
MPLPFSLVCDLLEESYALATTRKPYNQALVAWCDRYRSRINAPDNNLAALLSTLLPEKRTDRVYCIQANSLERIIGRGLMLGSSRLKELAIYKQPGLGLDLADCVERILTATPNPTLPERLQATVEEIDEALHSVAAKVKWSSPSIRVSEATVSKPPARSALEPLYRRLTAREAKWFTRLILKDFQPLVFDVYQVYHSCDPILPSILKVRQDFTIAIDTMQRLRKETRSLDTGTSYINRECLSSLKPQLSVKVGRQQWFKARSIKHCMNMCTGVMSVEAKVDGEYCQIHVDVSRGRRGIQIFSKSGKDSTEDRQRLIGIITDSLGIGKVESHVKTECILEGELAVYSELRQIINTSHPMAASALRNAFAKVITDRSEGLVLKADQPYFNFNDDKRPFTNYCIKFKKDYIGRFGEVGDFAVVGAGFNAAKARSYNIDNLKWTHFYVGCIDNREEVKRWSATPEFTVINVVELSEPMLKTFMLYANPKPVPVKENTGTKLKPAAGTQTTPMTVAFTNPPVFDLRCFNFDKAGCTNWWSLRFPSVAKIHFDRGFSDVLSFDELQKIAETATVAPELEDSRDNLAWIAKLEQADPRGLAVDAATQLTASTILTPSPRRASHNSSGSLPLIRHVAGSSLERSIESLGSSVSKSHRLAATQPSPTMNLSKISPFPNQKRKRTVSPTPTSPLKKRRNSSMDTTSRPGFRRAEPDFESPARRPLGEIDGNSTQQPQKTTTPSTKHPVKSEQQRISTHSQHCGEKEQGVFEQEGVTNSEDDGSESDATIPSSPLAYTRRHLSQNSEETRTDCQYAGLECQLANRLVLLPSHLSSLEEAEPLFQAHGLSNIVRDAEAWIKENTAEASLLQDGQTGLNKILFVDTVEKELETKELLSKIEDIRQEIPEEMRQWISVSITMDFMIRGGVGIAG